ncbi:ATPase [Aureococcus anophagefferens]|nr:ATPase [Aureococcus anophagefferens]
MSDALYEPLTVEEPEERSASYGGDAFELLKADRVCYLVAAPRAELSRGGGVGGAARRLCRSLRDGCCAPPHLKALVLDARFECRRGDFRAILGASGAGKSTFLQALSGRASGGVLAGAVSLDGFAFAPGSRRFRRAASPRTTARRTRGTDLRRNSGHRRGAPAAAGAAGRATAGRGARRAGPRARGVRGTAVGGALDKGLSGGQLRRLSVACATLGTGGHVLIDEPTSGLDSRTAAALCAVLEPRGRPRLGVACSIHTPPPECWAALDGVLVLATGGATLYAGSPAGAAAAVRARLGDDAQRFGRRRGLRVRASALCALALRPWPGGDDVLDFYFGDGRPAEPLAPCLLALCGCGAAALAGVYAALAAAPPAPRRPVKRSRLRWARRRAAARDGFDAPAPDGGDDRDEPADATIELADLGDGAARGDGRVALGFTAARVLAARGAARLARERAYLAACACRGFVVVGAYAALYRDVERDACAASYDALGLLFFVLLFVVMTQAATMLFSLASFLAVALAGYLVKLPGLPRPLRAAAALSFPRWAYEAAVLHEFAGRPELLGGSGYEDALFRAYGLRTRRSAPASPRSALLAALLAAHLPRSGA